MQGCIWAKKIEILCAVVAVHTNSNIQGCQTEFIQLLFHPLFTTLSVGLQATNFLFPFHQLFNGHCYCENACPQLRVGQIIWENCYLFQHSLLQLVKKEKNCRWQIEENKIGAKTPVWFLWVSIGMICV